MKHKVVDRRGGAQGYPVSPGAEQWQLLVDDHLLLVRRQARRIAEQVRRLDDLEDLVQAGFFGLVEAARRYKPGMGEFQSFASYRIRGAIIDEIRRLDWRPRRVSRWAARISDQIATLEQRLGRPPSEQEIACGLGCSLADYHQQLESIEYGQLESLSWEPLAMESPGLVVASGMDVDRHRLNDEQRQILTRAIERLSLNERQMLDFYYRQDLNQCEIAEIFQVSEPRVSQIHKQILLKLRAFLGDISTGGNDLC